MSNKGKLAWGWIAILVVLRNDFWNWGDDTLVLGFMPLGLLWQMGVSLGAAIGWAMVVRHAWPKHIEAWAGVHQEGPR